MKPEILITKISKQQIALLLPLHRELVKSTLVSALKLEKMDMMLNIGPVELIMKACLKMGSDRESAS